MPQHVRGDNFGPVRQVHLGGTLTANGLEQAATSANRAVHQRSDAQLPVRTQIDRPLRTEIAG
jgi:hypothetical protein